MDTTATQIEITTTIIPIESKTNLPYNFFISKHENKGRNIGLQIADALADLGFTYWISQHQDNADEDSIQQGIRDSEAIILVLTPGIFAPERRYVTNTEIKFAIDLKKPIILVDAGFTWSKLSPCMHLVECCENVAPEFQPYARALISALQVHRWHVDVRYRNVDMKIIIERYNARDKEAAKLCNYLAREVVNGECIHSKHHFDATKKSIGWTDRQHVMCHAVLFMLVAVSLSISVILVVTYFQRSKEQIKQGAFINGTTKMSCAHTFMDGKFCNSLPGEPDGGTILAEAGTTWETCAALCSIRGNSLGDTSACCNYRDGNGDATDGRCLYFSGGTVSSTGQQHSECDWESGDGKGGTEKNLGQVSSEDECLALVLAQEPAANGATFRVSDGLCWAEFEATFNDKSQHLQYRTCQINKLQINAHQASICQQSNVVTLGSRSSKSSCVHLCKAWCSDSLPDPSLLNFNPNWWDNIPYGCIKNKHTDVRNRCWWNYNNLSTASIGEFIQLRDIAFTSTGSSTVGC